jgi:hypothetical protein
VVSHDQYPLPGSVVLVKASQLYPEQNPEKCLKAFFYPPFQGSMKKVCGVIRLILADPP